LGILKMSNKIKQETQLPTKLLSKAEASMSAQAASTNVWKDAKTYSTKVVDRDAFAETVTLCRFFYKTEPLVSTVINKLVEIAQVKAIVVNTIPR